MAKNFKDTGAAQRSLVPTGGGDGGGGPTGMIAKAAGVCGLEGSVKVTWGSPPTS